MIYGSREQIFREHEHIFAGYMQAYPKSLEVQCGQMVPESLASRLRRIAKDLMHYGWETSFSTADFRAVWSESAIRVSMARTVVIGPKKGKIELATPVRRGGGQAGQTARHMEGPRALECLLHLHSTGVFVEATHMPTLGTAEAEALQARLKVEPMNVEFIKHPSEPGYLLF